MPELIGQTLGQYRIIERIGQGGMATVYKAYQPGLDRDVALKILPPFHAEQPGFSERFRREARAIANLHHPNILPVHDSGQDGDYSYIVMRYIDGARTLADVMRRGRLTPEQASNLIGQIASALGYAHRQGIIHRDIKPGNVLMDGDWVLLTDFGLAKMTEASVKLTGTGVGMGTPAYMSPEQGQGKLVDHRTDIYALGVILYEMLTGQIPHDADTPFGIIVKRMSEPLPLPHTLNPAITEPVERVILKSLAANPADRFDDAEAMAMALRMAVAGRHPGDNVPTQASPRRADAVTLADDGPSGPIVPPGQPSSTSRRKWIAAAVAFVVVAIIGAGLLAAGLWLFSTSAPETPVVEVTTLLPTAAPPPATETPDNDATIAAAVAATQAAEPTATQMPTATFTPIPTPTDTPIATPTDTPLPTATDTPLPTVTDTAIPPTATPTVAVTPPVLVTLVPIVTLAPVLKVTLEPEIIGGADMVLVPAGPFTMGSDSGGAGEKPVHTVTLDAYYIDQYEVTNAAFRQCVEAGVCEAPTTCNNGESTYNDTGKADHPVVCVDWYEAKAYCEWRGAKLPTEAEWEKAARGTDGRTYPWGEEVNCKLANHRGTDGWCVKDTTSVGSYPLGISPYGVYDMAGNVLEWVQSIYGHYPYEAEDGREYLGGITKRVTRGGSWYNNDYNTRTTLRGSTDPDNTSYLLGFRCVRSVSE